MITDADRESKDRLARQRIRKPGKPLLLLMWATIAGILISANVRQQRERRLAREAQERAISLRERHYQQQVVRSHLMTPIADAAKRGDLPEFRRLMANAFPDGPDEEAGATLFGAAGNGHVNILKFWFSQPWPILYQGKPLAQCLLGPSGSSKSPETVKYLLSLVPHDLLISLNSEGLGAACMGNTEADAQVAKIFIEAGANVNYVYHQSNSQGQVDAWAGRTPLMYAARRGRSDVAKALLEHHADVNRISDKGETALQIAQKYGHPDVAALLKQAARSTSH